MKLGGVARGRHDPHVRLHAGGTLVAAAIANEAVDELGLAVGREACAAVKALDVTIAVDRGAVRDIGVSISFSI